MSVEPVSPVDIIRSLEEELSRVKAERDFTRNWLSDLLETIEQELDEPTRVRLMEGCGRGCFRRHQFKQDLAAKAEGSLEKLIEAYKANFEIWQDSDGVHIRYGAVSRGCFCPAAQGRSPRPGDLHCECTRATHQSIFEKALGRPFSVKILESVRRGGKTCHLLVNEAARAGEAGRSANPSLESPGSLVDPPGMGC